MRDIKQSKIDEISQNFLITAQRGMGKTTLLLRLEYEVNATAELSHLIPIRFSEEQYNIVSFCNLWEVVADALEEREGFGGIVEQVERSIESDDESCFEPIKKALQKERKKLLLLVDNFQDMLNKFTDNEIKELRDILHSTELQLVSASSIAIENTYHHDKPFFEFFKSIQLDGLTTTESQELFKKLAENHPKGMQNYDASRIEIVKRLTGGVPRTMIIIFEIFLDRNAEIFENLEYILDQVTPLYKHRMDDLTPQQQRIAHEIAIAWDGISFDELKKKTRTDEEELRGYLLELEKAYFIDVRSVGTTVDIYLLKERFFNIWYLMRNGRTKNQEHIKWLIKFLEAWFTPDELKDRILSHIRLVKKGEMSPRGALFMAEAFSVIIDDEELEYQILKETKDFLQKNDSNLANLLILNNIGMQSKNNKYYYVFKLFWKVVAIFFKKFSKFIYFYRYGVDISLIKSLYFGYKKEDEKSYFYAKKALQYNDNNDISYLILSEKFYDEKEYEKAHMYIQKAIEIDKKEDSIWSFIYYGILGDRYKKEKNYKKAIIFYKKSISVENSISKLYTELADLYKIQKEYDIAIENYKQAIAIDANDVYEYRMIGLIYYYQEEYNNAIKWYKKALEIDNKYVYTYNDLGNIYKQKKEYEKAIKWYKKANTINDKYISAYQNLGNLYKLQDKYDESILNYKKVIELDDKYISAYNSLGIIYIWKKEYDKAIEYFNKVKKIDSGLAYVYINLGYCFSQKESYDEAISLYQKSIELKPKYELAYYNMGKTYTNKGDYDKAIESYQKAIELNPKDFWNLYHYAKTLLIINKYNDSLKVINDILVLDDYLEFIENITHYFLLLLAKQQPQRLDKLFKEYPNLKYEFKPVYYTLMYFMQDEYPTEYQRMGAELEETVQEMVDWMRLGS